MTAVVEEPVRQLVDDLAGLPPGHPSSWDLEELRTGIPALFEISNRLASLQMEALASYDARGGAQVDGHRTTGDWLKKTTRVCDAGSRVHTARDLRDHLPATADALHAGAISPDHVRVVRRGLRMLGEEFSVIESTVVDFARSHTAKELRAFLDRVIQQYTPERSEDEAEVKREKRKLFLSQSLDGWWHVNGLLDPATGEIVRTALEAYSQPVSASDRRSDPTRRADALAEIAERAMQTEDRPTGFGQLTVVATAEQLDTGLGVQWPSGSLMSRTDFRGLSCGAAVRYVAGLPTDDPVRWQPLAVGFARRYATSAQRTALVARDGGGCVHPGCTVPGWRCVAHHIRPWDQGGPTDLPNLVLLCRYHHRSVHRGRLRIRWTDGHATTGPP